ncbi:hypothetical protein BDV09DRAFT_161322 [Aspergillus tetrazonus]
MTVYRTEMPNATFALHHEQGWNEISQNHYLWVINLLYIHSDIIIILMVHILCYLCSLAP